ncbi:hypothetical protein MKW98_024529 [Papaver atlanticum]|uniref:Nuclear pore complex protein n=1 Tax=Papaver atlanticum TaxID=357466 RepID=A0AAD4X346_9MAGN|nr:hypothetical protein MKW98_024529 [Papaver atlanticum]
MRMKSFTRPDSGMIAFQNSCQHSHKVKECHVGTYLPSSGVWHQTQWCPKKGLAGGSTIQHLDFDPPTCEMAQLLPDDKKQDESLLEDVWTLLRVGRLEEARELCRSAGQVSAIKSWNSLSIWTLEDWTYSPQFELWLRMKIMDQDVGNH